MKAEAKIEESVELPQGVTASTSNSTLTLKGPKGEASRNLYSEKAEVLAEDGKITIKAKRSTKKEKKVAGTFRAHINNMIKGVVEGHHYTLKVCSGHFPMNVSVSGREFIVKNFLGEKTARKISLPAGVTVKVNGSDIDVEGTDKDITGTVAAAIENLTKRPNFDRRIFQDGIILTGYSQE